MTNLPRFKSVNTCIGQHHPSRHQVHWSFIIGYYLSFAVICNQLTFAFEVGRLQFGDFETSISIWMQTSRDVDDARRTSQPAWQPRHVTIAVQGIRGEVTETKKKWQTWLEFPMRENIQTACRPPENGLRQGVLKLCVPGSTLQNSPDSSGVYGHRFSALLELTDSPRWSTGNPLSVRILDQGPHFEYPWIETMMQ